MIDNIISMFENMGIEPVIVLAGMSLGLVLIICILGAIIYKIVATKINHESVTSLPQGTDKTKIGELLQERYKAERDSDDYRREL